MKIKLTISKLIYKACLKASLVVAVVGLSALISHLELKARLDHQEADPVVSKVKVPQETKVQPIKIGLAPNPYLLAQVKDQASQKPVFDKKSTRFDEMIEKAAREHRISPALVKAVIQAESRFDTRAVSAQGAVGLMQILPSTARSMGVSSPQEPYNNITAGVRYLKMLLEEFGNDEYLALAAYNCGPDTIKRYGGQMPPFSETRSFVRQVMSYYQSHIES
ncbi:MAG: lytic transglycosylase domain-containing protein [Deltaproteobacteria bacterium]|jgi:soluble lytic murein transglycosylase-like protein|nr:lytic transglycosylase domain-containing protein [Deltaproteobacteria bacterium]